MLEQATETFLENLALLCRRSSIQNGENILNEVLNFFAQTCQTQHAAIILLDENNGGELCLAIAPPSPTTLSGTWENHLKYLPDNYEAIGLTQIPRHETHWILPIPTHTRNPQAVVCLAHPVFVQDQHRLEQAADTLGPLLQNLHWQREHLSATAENKPGTYHARNINTLLAALNRAVNIQEILHIGLDQALQITGMEWGGIYLWDPETQHLHLKASRGTIEEAKLLQNNYTTNNNLLALASSPHTADSDSAPEQLGSRLALPLMIEKQPMGMLTLSSSQSQPLQVGTEHLLRTIVDQLTLALQREQMAGQLQQQLRFLHELYEFSAAFLPQIGSREVIFILLRTLTDLLTPAMGAAFYQFSAEEGWQRTKVYTTHSGALLTAHFREGPVWENEEPLLENCLHTNAPTFGLPGLTLPNFWNPIAAIGGRQLIYLPLHSPAHEITGAVSVILSENRLLNAQESALTMALMQQALAALARVRLYETSRDTELRLRAILESSQDGIFLISEDLKIRYVNSPALHLLALPGEPENWRNHSFPDAILSIRTEALLLAQELATACRNQRNNQPCIALAANDELTFETLHRRTITLRRWPVYSERHQLLGTLFLLRDVSEQKALEKMRDELLRMLVHDMRNPLSIILSALQVMQDPVMKDDASQIMEIARNNTEQVLTLVTAILDIGKLESGQFELCQQNFRLATFLPQLSTALTLSAKKPTFQSNLPADLPYLWADVNVVGRILQNLIENALKFVPPTGGTIRLAAYEEESWVRIEVFNDGPHIPPEIGDQLFQKFKTVHYRGQGYGLGLTFCRLAVEAHGGRIWAENQPTGGVSFFFTLPAAPTLVYPIVTGTL